MPNRELRKLSSSKPFDSGYSSLHTDSSRRESACANPPVGPSDAFLQTHSPFVQRNGRTYLNNPKLPYPLPVDLAELNRQSLRTLLLIQIHGAPLRCPTPDPEAHLRILELACGQGFWSLMCYRHLKSLGFKNVSFYGIDAAPLTDPSDTEEDMDWTFVQHDVTQPIWPLPENHFDIIMSKDMLFCIPQTAHDGFAEQIFHTLKPGGLLEIWDTDLPIRLIRPHVPSTKVKGMELENHQTAKEHGIYVVNHNTPLSAPTSPHLVEYNRWVTEALVPSALPVAPCAMLNQYMYQEGGLDIHAHRFAIPFSEMHWERKAGLVISPEQMTLRSTALLTFIQEVQSLELLLRGVNGKSQDEWDAWLEKLMLELMSDNGTSWGECLETGAWWARNGKPEV